MPASTARRLEEYSELEWNDAPLHTHCKRAEVESAKVKLILAGDGTVHPIEAEYLRPEVHSLMNISRPVLTAAELNRLILFVSESMEKLKGTYVQKYLRYGEKTSFASKKSKAVPVPQRSTCVEDKQPLVTWIAGEVTDSLTVNIPEGHASLPDANDMLDANTIFFRQPKGGKAVAQPLALPSRAHAEMVHLLTQRSVHGAVRLPKTEKAAQILQAQITKRLAALVAKANELSRSRTGDEKKAMELAYLLEFWMVHGKPHREAKQKELASKAGD